MTDGPTEANATPTQRMPTGPTPADQSIAVILPAYNEAGRIDATLRAIAAYRERIGVQWPVVVADDGSTDGTADVARATAATIGLPVEVLQFAHRGKALTIRDAKRMPPDMTRRNGDGRAPTAPPTSETRRPM